MLTKKTTTTIKNKHNKKVKKCHDLIWKITSNTSQVPPVNATVAVKREKDGTYLIEKYEYCKKDWNKV